MVPFIDSSDDVRWKEVSPGVLRATAHESQDMGLYGCLQPGSTEVSMDCLPWRAIITVHAQQWINVRSDGVIENAKFTDFTMPFAMTTTPSAHVPGGPFRGLQVTFVKLPGVHRFNVRYLGDATIKSFALKTTDMPSLSIYPQTDGVVTTISARCSYLNGDAIDVQYKT